MQHGCLGIGTTPALAAETFDFEEFARGVWVTNQLVGRGVDFPNGVQVTNEPLVPGNKVIRTRRVGEFERERLIIEFTVPQNSVSMDVRFDALYADDDDMRIIITALSQTTTVDSNQVTLPCGTGDATEWCTLTVADNTRGIDRVEVEGRLNGMNLNVNLVADNLTIVSDVPPPPPVDTEPPTVSILQPPDGAVFNSRQIISEIHATDNQQLQTVHLITQDETGTFFFDIPLCGGGASGPCLDREFNRVFSALLPDQNGTYTFTARACDSAGNCREVSRNIVLDLPPPPPPVFAYKVEVNQGISNVLYGPNYGWTQSSRLVPGKDTVVRWYLFGEGGPRPDFSEGMDVTVFYRGTHDTFHIRPNTQDGTADVPEDPGVGNRDDMAMWEMRPDLSQTLNFVIPGTYLDNVDVISLKLRHGITLSQTQLRLRPPVVLNLNLIRVQSSLTGTIPTIPEVDDTIINYLKIAFPVSDVVVRSRRTFSNFPIRVCLRFADIDVVCYRFDSNDDLMALLWLTYSGDSWADFAGGLLPFVSSGPSVGQIPLGVVTQMPDGCCGGGVGLRPDRYEALEGLVSVRIDKGAALTTLFGDTAAQEIGHAIGFKHTSNVHNEATGGEWEPPPFPHATLGPRDMGAIPQQSLPPGSPGFPNGEWNIELVDPCPGVTGAGNRAPCTLPDGDRPHEFMSYGPGQSRIYGRWISSLGYMLLHNRILYEGLTRASVVPTAAAAVAPKDEPEERVEALLIDGEVQDDGSIQLLPLLRKPLPMSMLDVSDTGQYTLELHDVSGNILLEHPFDSMEFGHTDPKKFVNLTVPFVEGVTRVVIKEGEAIVADEGASPNPPVVSILEPQGGEILESGIHTVRWEASDPDGDPLTFLVQYSPDNGKSWQGIDLVSGDTFETQLDVNELISGQKGFIRITASDGFNTTATKTGFFSVGTELPPESECTDTIYSRGKSLIKYNHRQASKDKGSLRMCVNQTFCDVLRAGVEEIVLGLSGCNSITIPGSSLRPTKFGFRARSSTYTLKINCKKGWFKLRLKNTDLQGCVSNPVKTCVSIKDDMCLCAEEEFEFRRDRSERLKKLSFRATGACSP